MLKDIWTRDFSLCFAAQAAMAFVFCLLIPTLPIYLSDLGAKEVEIGLLVGVASVSSLVARPWVGRILLRVPEKRFMMMGAIIYALSSFLYLFVKPFFPLFVVRTFHGIGIAFFSTALITLVARISPENQRGRSLSIFYLAFSIPFALAPSAAILILDLSSFQALFLICTSISLCGVVVLLRLRTGAWSIAESSKVAKQPAVIKEILPLAIISFTGNMIGGAVMAFYPLFALSHGVRNPGLFFTVFAATLVLFRGVGGRILDVLPAEKIIPPCLIFQIVAMVALSFSKTSSQFLLVAVIWGIGNAYLYPSLMASTIAMAGASRGPALGIYTALSDLGSGLGSVIMGIVLHFTNYRVMFLCLALTALINFWYCILMVRKKR